MRQRETVEVSFVFNFIPLLSNIKYLSYHLSSSLLPLSTQQQQGLITNSTIKSEGWIQTTVLRSISSLKSATPFCNEFTPSSVPLLRMNILPSHFLRSIPAYDCAFVFSSDVNLDESGSGAIGLVYNSPPGGKVMECSSTSSSSVVLPSVIGELMVEASARFEREGNW